MSVRGRHVELDDCVTVGRSGSCDVVLHRDEEASRVHARFVVRGNSVFVEDLNSTNGTFVGGDRVVGARQLVAGDLVRIGSSLVTFARRPASQTSSERLAALAAMDNRQLGIPTEATRPADIFEVLERVVRKAIETETPLEAERVTAAHLHKLLEEVREGTANPDHVERAIRIAADLARALPSQRWLEYLVELHSRLHRPLGDDHVDLLCAATADGAPKRTGRTAPSAGT